MQNNSKIGQLIGVQKCRRKSLKDGLLTSLENLSCSNVNGLNFLQRFKKLTFRADISRCATASVDYIFRSDLGISSIFFIAENLAFKPQGRYLTLYYGLN